MIQFLPRLHKTQARSPALALEGGVLQKGSVDLKQQALNKVSLRLIVENRSKNSFYILKNHERKQT